ncbi:peroxiredoxin [Jannaschia sp. W003]|uniref:peroxiredoxin n=1 Tax=Jannaschia sp. W003 TaxID=2867012 RepID=UPI0021A25CD5|nr:peroxiredoxin [Jannaschia sp. W003]UWQ20740.1 peroxiredoxin [Jannaschia sp. W003]
MPMTLAPGQPAPDFELPRDGGDTVRLSALRGAPVVLFFYPRDDTPGCTREATAFTALLPRFEAAGARVLGISRDTVAKHERFRDKHDLAVPLLSDEDGAVCEAYGVWREKTMYGRTSMRIERTTVLVGADGTITEIWRRVRVDGHAEAVLAAVEA